MGKASAYLVPVWAFVLLAMVTVVGPASAGSDVADLRAIEGAFVQLAQRVSPSVVAIDTTIAKPFSAGGDAASQVPMVGSGLIISDDGLILTNNHVVRDAFEIFVSIDGGKRYAAQLVARDTRSDLAVIRIDAHDLVPVVWGDLQEVRVGQWALAMGNPFGMAKDGRPALSYGIVSALGKSLRSLEDGGKKYYGNLIQTTADINPGNSGGPLFNIEGQVIGVNTAIETSSGVTEGLGFAIPISARTRKIISTLSRGEPVQYGFLGINIRDLDELQRKQVAKPNRWGVSVTEVFPDTPAALADLREGDIILNYDHTLVRDTDHLIRMVGATPIGETVSLIVVRDDLRLTVVATVGRRNLILAGSTD